MVINMGKENRKKKNYIDEDIVEKEEYKRIKVTKDNWFLFEDEVVNLDDDIPSAE